MPLVNLLQQIDLSILFFINKTLANPFFDVFLKLTHFLPYVFWTFLILFLIFKKKHSLAKLMIVAVAVNLVIVLMLKTAIERERPYQVLDVRQLVPEEDNRSFPSNHVQTSFLFSTIVFAFYRRLGIALFLLSAVIGIGRVYVGVHYPSDVIGGALIGILLAVLILKLKHKII